MKQDDHTILFSMDELDKKILVILQGDLGNDPEPYASIGAGLNVTEAEVIRRIKRMIDAGVIRRMGAMIRHIEAGIGYNGMVVWNVDPDQIDQVGKLMAGFPEVTHCYERPAFSRFGGTLFTMVHAESEAECQKIVEKLAEASGIKRYEVLFSKRELKKISMTYFGEDPATKEHNGS